MEDYLRIESNSEPHVDSALIKAIQAGDAVAFKALYHQYSDALFGFLWRRLGQRELAEDLVQETFARCWHKRASIKPDLSPKPYLFQIARNLLTDHLRQWGSRGVSVELSETLPDEQPDPNAFEVRDRLMAAIEQLPRAQKNVFCLSRLQGLKYAEIATKLNISVKTVEVHMGRATKGLRKLLGDLAPLLFFTFLW